MNEKELLRELNRVSPPDIQKRYLKAAATLFLRDSAKSRAGPDDIEDCLELARVVRSTLAGSPDKTDVLTLVPAVLVDSRRVAEAVRPLIEGVRRLVFESPEPPFSSREEAFDWLKYVEAKQKRPNAKDEEKSWKMIFEAQSLIRKPLELKTVTLPFIDPRSGEIEHMEAFFGSEIHVLSGQSSALAQMTGFSLVGVLEYILVDIQPLLPAFRMKKTLIPLPRESGRSRFITRSVSIEVNSRHLNESNFRQIWREADGILKERNKRPTRPRTVMLINMVRKCLENRPADETKTDFWKRVQDEFNRSAGKRFDKYRTWQAPRRTYLRLAETPEYEHLPLP